MSVLSGGKKTTKREEGGQEREHKILLEMLISYNNNNLRDIVESVNRSVCMMCSSMITQRLTWKALQLQAK